MLNDGIRVLWTHNFNPQIENAGVFMHALTRKMGETGVDVDLHYLGNLRKPQEIVQANHFLQHRAQDYDVVHAQFGSVCSWITSRVRRSPTVVSLRGSDWHIYRNRLNGSFVHNLLAHLITRASLRRFRAVIVMSNRMKREILPCVNPKAKVHVIPSGIDLQRFQPMDKMEARRRLGCGEDTRYWVLFTTLSLNNKIKRAKLAQKAVTFANELLRGRVKLAVASGLQHSDMPLFVNACDAALTTSVHEGWPNCIKEALACNVPFVATDVSDLYEIASQEPSCRVCDANPRELGQALCEVLTMTKKNDLLKYVKSMEIGVVANSILRVYESILTSHDN